MNKGNVPAKLTDIFRILSSCKKIQLTPIVTITPKDIISPVQDLSDSVFRQRSAIPDTFISMEKFQILVDRLNSSVTGLDHVGFCYTVDSQEKELARILRAMKHTTFHLYEMTSNDLAKWYFIGNAKNWKEPMIELLPTLPNDDSELAYWMPHIQIDIETKLDWREIEKTMVEIVPDARPVKFSDPAYGVYNVRMRLGSVDGINIMFDVGTNVSNLRWSRGHLLREIKVT